MLLNAYERKICALFYSSPSARPLLFAVIAWFSEEAGGPKPARIPNLGKYSTSARPVTHAQWDIERSLTSVIRYL